MEAELTRLCDPRVCREVDAYRQARQAASKPRPRTPLPMVLERPRLGEGPSERRRNSRRTRGGQIMNASPISGSALFRSEI
jgi:hypothetical protein